VRPHRQHASFAGGCSRELPSPQAPSGMPYRGRIAYPSFVDKTLFGNPHETAIQMARSMPAGMKDSVVISTGELQTMAYRSKIGPPEPSAKQLDRERLHHLSDARKAKWPNTIEANRERKERMRLEKQDAEERLRLEIDKEEAALQGEKRRLAIERANKMLYDNTDRIKSLHSKLMLADVMEERQRQLELKRRLRQQEIEDEERWYQRQQDAIRRMDAEEDLRDEEEMSKRGVIAKARKEQIQGQMDAQAAMAVERKREGEAMIAMAKADAEAEQRQHIERVEAEKRARAEVVEANEYLLKRRAEDQALMEAEEQRMLAYATMKEKDLLERRDREEQRFRERQAWRQQMIDKQIAKLTDMNASSNARLEKQAAEVQAKAQAARERLDAQKKTELLTMHMSRQQQIRWKAEKDTQQRCEDQHLAKEMQKMNAKLREEEAMAIRSKFERNKTRDHNLLEQMAEKAEKLEAEKLEEMYEAELTKQWGKDDDAIFDQYAQLCLDEYVAQGKNPEPIEMMMKKIKEKRED